MRDPRVRAGHLALVMLLCAKFGLCAGVSCESAANEYSTDPVSPLFGALFGAIVGLVYHLIYVDVTEVEIKSRERSEREEDK